MISGSHCTMNKLNVRIWKAVLILLGIVSLSSGLIKTPGFWSSYLLDIAGPAWGYVLIRAQYKEENSGFLSIRFSPEGALFTIILICFSIETAQYLELYIAYFDPFDYLAYISGVFPAYLLDRFLSSSEKSYKKKTL